MVAERLRIAMFSTTVNGGAGYAALRVHDALRLGGGDSTLYVGQAERGRYPGVRRLRDAREGYQPRPVPGRTNFSVDAPGIPDTELDHIIAQADIFNLHWYARFLSLRNIERLSCSGKPVVITVRDMNPLAGGCHFFHGCGNWKGDCAPCPQFVPAELPLPMATFQAKRALWNFDNITVVVLSDHTRDLVRVSPMLSDCRVEKIPNPIDVSIFKPHDRDRSRAALGMPICKHAIAYLPSFSSAVKGAAQAVEALRQLANKLPVEKCVVVCAGELDAPLDVAFKTVNVGFIADRKKLAQFYAGADVTLIPSTEETFSNTAAESVACGTPVVGFQIGAIPEIAQGARGRAVPVDDIDALGGALYEVLSAGRSPTSELHDYVVENFGATTIGGQYLRLFETLCAENRVRGGARKISVWEDARRHETDQRFGCLLKQYHERRGRESRSLRARLAVLARAAKLFFFDNRTFRRQVWRVISERR